MSKIINITAFFLFFVMCVCVQNILAESCSTVNATQNKYAADGCTYTTKTRTCCSNKTWSEWDKECTCTKTTCAANYYWKQSDCACVACGVPSMSPYQFTSTTSPTASQYKAHAVMCQFKLLCMENRGWGSDPGTGLNYCICEGGYSWNSSSKTCERKTCVKSTEYPVTSAYMYSSPSEAINLCNSGPYPTEKSGRLGNGYIWGTLTSCPHTGPGYFHMTDCTSVASGGQYAYTYTTTVYTCGAC